MKARLKRGTLFLACANLTMFMTGAPTYAQGNTDRTETALSDDIGSIVVTARRREERLQDVPIAVSVITSDELRQKAVQYYDDLVRLAPGIQLTPVSHGKSELTLTIRSQRPSISTINADPTVGVYFADVVQAHTQGMTGVLYDLSSVQVLKGAQGTLFGKNTTGGAVVITPQAPTDKFEGYLSGTVGRFDQAVLEGAVNVPVSDKLQLRLSGQVDRRDGYVKNLADGKKYEDVHTDSWRVSARFTPTDNIENKLVVYGVKVKENGQAVRSTDIGPPATGRYPDLQAAFTALSQQPFYVVNFSDANLPQGDYVRTANVSNITSLNLSGITLKNIFGYRYVKADMGVNQGGLPFNLLQAQEVMKVRQYSDEFQVLGQTLDNNLDYIAGFYYFTESGFNSTNTDSFSIALNRQAADVGNSSKAVFAQGTYKLPFLNTVSVTAGLRQTWDHRRIRWYQTTTNIATGVTTCREVDGGGVPLNPCSIGDSIDNDKLTYNFSIDWHVTSDVMLYFTHRKGYRSGGFDATGGINPLSRMPYNPETVKDYEVGAKTEWRLGDVQGHFNIAAYHQDFQDIQQAAPVVGANGVFAGARIYNAATAKIEGVETDLSINPVRDVEITASWAFSQPKFTKFSRLAQVAGPYFNQIVDATRTPFPGAPKNTVGAAIRWTLPTPESMGVMAISADYYYQSSMFTQSGDLDYTTLLPYYRGGLIPGYGIAGARVEWNNIMTKPVDAAFYVKNLTGKKYYYYGLDLLNPAFALGTTVRYMGVPRTWSFKLTYHF
jgi:iron complex outermembrane receptor protein